MAQEATETPAPKVSPENEALAKKLERAELERKLAEAEQKKAEAERKELEAKLPKTETKGPTGDVTLKDSPGYFAELLAYRTLNNAAQEIALQVADKVAGKVVFVTDQVDINANEALRQIIDLKLGDFEGRFDQLLARYPLQASGKVTIPAAPESLTAAALLAIPSFLGAAADIAAFFKVDVEISGKAITLADRALLAEMASAMRTSNLKPTKIEIPSLRFSGKGELILRLERVQGLRRDASLRRQKVQDQIQPNPARLVQVEAETVAKAAELAKLEGAKADPDAIKTAKAELTKLKQEKLDLARAIQTWERTKADFDLLMTEFASLEGVLTSRPAGGGLAPLELVATVDALQSADAGTKILLVNIVSQGGEIQVTKSAWRSGRISYVGGSAVTYFLIDAETGDLEASGVVPGHLAASFKGSAGAEQLPAHRSNIQE